MLISLAAYSRYSRASLLDVMNQDYIRTARAKGLSERIVVMRHAFRNALIPITTDRRVRHRRPHRRRDHHRDGVRLVGDGQAVQRRPARWST